jgi:hypothetical protein
VKLSGVSMYSISRERPAVWASMIIKFYAGYAQYAGHCWSVGGVGHGWGPTLVFCSRFSRAGCGAAISIPAVQQLWSRDLGLEVVGVEHTVSL